MGNDVLRIELQHLERKVRVLLSEHSQVKTEVALLRAENEALKSQIESKTAHLSNFQNQMKMSKIVESMIVGEGSTSELREVIDDYIKEIDKCIAHLGEA